MIQDTDFKVLEFATKGKKFLTEIVSQTREDFYGPDTRIALKILRDYHKEHGDVPSYEMACEYGGAYPNFEQTKEILHKAYNTDKATLVDGDFPELIKKVKKQYNDAYVKEKIKHITQGMAGKYDINDINEHIKKIALEISTLKDTQTYSQGAFGDSAKQDYLNYLKIKENPDLARGVMSGFGQLDSITNGFRGCELILVAGPSGSGKSCFLMNMAMNAWLGNNKPIMPNNNSAQVQFIPENKWDKSGKNVWFITIENSMELQRRRMMSCLAGVSCDGIRDGNLNEVQEQLYMDAIKFRHKYSKEKTFYISDFGKNITMAVIEVEYEKILQQFKPELIVIDYLGKMKAIAPTGIDWLDQGSIALDMYEFTKSIEDTPVITAAQMKAAMRTHSGLKRFEGDVENISRSKMIGDNVSMNLQIVKGEDYAKSSYMTLVVAKNRDGKDGDEMTFVKEFWRQIVYDQGPINIVKDEDIDD